MKTITIIDDDVAFCNALELVLKKAGYAVNVENTGQSILSNQFPVPDLLILDRYLPELDGLELCRKLRTQQETSNLPVVMISGNDTVKFHASMAGATDFLSKPFDVNHLLKMLSFHCSYAPPKGPNNKWRKLPGKEREN